MISMVFMVKFLLSASSTAGFRINLDAATEIIMKAIESLKITD